MARAQFDRNEVIEKSIKLFWENGYSASSMKNVVQATGLKPGSLYLSFGNKEALFRESLECYAQKALTQIRHTMDNSFSAGEGIIKILENNIEDTNRENYSSCFLIKTQLELAAAGNELYEYASMKLSEIEALYRSYLEKEYNEDVSRQRATSLMLHIFGMRTYGYQQGSAENIREGLQEGLPWLPWKKKIKCIGPYSILN